LNSHAWVWQEKGKGVSPLNTVLGSTHGGWKFNLGYYTNGVHMSASQANALPASQIQTNAFFDMSFDSALFNPATGSTYAQANRHRILSDAIPAMSWAVGSHAVTQLDVLFGGQHNFNMQAEFQNGWPQKRLTSGENNNNWYHSDVQQLAYTFTYPLFNKWVTLGNLK
jgi:hypothetical protein